MVLLAQYSLHQGLRTCGPPDVIGSPYLTMDHADGGGWSPPTSGGLEGSPSLIYNDQQQLSRVPDRGLPQPLPTWRCQGVNLGPLTCKACAIVPLNYIPSTHFYNVPNFNRCSLTTSLLSTPTLVDPGVLDGVGKVANVF